MRLNDVPLFDIREDLDPLNSSVLIFVRLMSNARLLVAIPGQNGSINPAMFGSSPVLLFKRLKSQAFMELLIQTPFCATARVVNGRRIQLTLS